MGDSPASSQRAPIQSGSGHRGYRFEYVALAAVVLLVYFPALSATFVNWDDDRYVLDNPALRSTDGLWAIWTTVELPKGFPNYPLSMTSLWLDHQLWGVAPSGYHWTNVFLHLCNTLLVLTLVRALGATDWPARATAALFAVHPMQVESVAWVSERKNLLSGCFFLIAFILYLRQDAPQRWRWGALSLVSFAAALLSKTATVVLPVSILLAQRFMTGRWRGTDLRRAAPMFAIGLAPAWLTLTVEPESGSLPLPARPLLAAASTGFYALKLIAPVKLLPLYPRWNVSVSGLFWWLPLLALLAAAIIVYRYATHWHLRWGLAHFICMLLPTLGLVGFGFHTHSYVADRFVYLAAIGFFLALSTAADQLHRSVGAPITAIAVLLVFLFGGLAWRQTQVWRNSIALWTYTLAGNPGSLDARNNLARALIDQGRLDEADAHLHAALAISALDADAHNNLCVLFARRADFGAAIDHCRQAIASAPDDAVLRKNLGEVLEARGQLAAAEAQYRRAAELSPEYDSSHRLGRVLLAEGRAHEAIPELQRALQLQADMVEAQNDLGRALLEVGRVQEAISVFATVVRLQPDSAEAYFNLGLALHRAGRSDDAVRQFEAALRISPELTDAAQALTEVRAGLAAGSQDAPTPTAP